MPWAALITILMELFGPVIRAWLQGVLDRAAPKAGFPPPSFEPAAVAASTNALFEAARAELSWWQFGRKARLDVLGRIARGRAGAIADRALGGSAPTLTRAEAAEIAASAF